MPSFPGGDGALYGFLAQNISYPEIAKRAGVEGQVIVMFTVSKTGQIASPRVVRGIGGGCDEEALRVVMMMPRWNPGKQNGQPVNVQVTVPIRFQLQ
jgi:protein TonB